MLSVCTVSVSASQSDSSLDYIYDCIDSAVEWKNSETKTSSDSIIDSDMIEHAGSSVYDWFVFSVGRLGRNDNYAEYSSALCEYAQGDNSEIITDYQRIALTYAACGNSADDGVILNKAVFDSLDNDNMNGKTVNVRLYALLTLDSLQYELPEDANLSRQSLIESILSSRLENGAFYLMPNTPETDVTAIAVQALAPYYNCGEEFSSVINGENESVTVREAVDDAIDYLSTVQLEDGDMPSWGAANCESTAQTIVALCTLGIDPETDKRFIKNGNTLIDGLNKYRLSDGGYAHTLDSEESEANPLATAEALYSLCAYCRYKNGYRNLYDMRSEQSQELYNKITELDEKISCADAENTELLKQLLSAYEDIPLNERFYVHNFYILADALDKQGIENTADYLPDDLYSGKTENSLSADVTVSREKMFSDSAVIESPDGNFEPLASSEASAAPASYASSHGVAEIAVLIGIAIAAIIIIVLNHSRKGK